MKPTAFVSHSDCALHDTGWKHPEHQGRLPALTRAVYRDMLALHDRLLEVEAQPASEDDLLLVHTSGYVASVREAAERAEAAGESRVLEGETKLSGASWRAALAAAGTVLTGVEVVLARRARNAFCAARPPGQAARTGGPAEFAIFNNVAIAARHLRQRRGIERLLIVRWGGGPGGALAEIFADEPAVRILAVHQQSPLVASAPPESSRPPPEGHAVSLPAGSEGPLFISAFEAALDEVLAGFAPEMILLSAGFDTLAADPLGTLALEPRDFHALTLHLRERADALCKGRLVSALEGGYAPAALGLAVVQQLRALSGLPPA